MVVVKIPVLDVPTTVDILGAPFQVVINDEPDREGAEGLTQYAKGVICLSQNLSEVRRPDTLRHEIGHGVSFQCGFSWYLKERVGERLASELEEAMLQMFVPAYLNCLLSNDLI